MDRYYDIGLDYGIEDQWHLAWPTTEDGTKLIPGRLSNGLPWDPDQKLFSRVHTCGRSVNFTLGTHNFFVTTKIMDVLRSALPAGNVQGVPIDIEGESEPYEILNVLDVVDCLDEDRSDLSWWTEEDGWPEKVGTYDVNVLKVDPARAQGHDLFRVKTWPVALVCSERIRDLLVANGVTGIRFTLAS